MSPLSISYVVKWIKHPQDALVIRPWSYCFFVFLLFVSASFIAFSFLFLLFVLTTKEPQICVSKLCIILKLLRVSTSLASELVIEQFDCPYLKNLREVGKVAKLIHPNMLNHYWNILYSIVLDMFFYEYTLLFMTPWWQCTNAKQEKTCISPFIDQIVKHRMFCRNDQTLVL